MPARIAVGGIGQDAQREPAGRAERRRRALAGPPMRGDEPVVLLDGSAVGANSMTSDRNPSSENSS